MCKQFKHDRVGLLRQGRRSLLSCVFVYVVEDDSAPYSLGPLDGGGGRSGTEDPTPLSANPRSCTSLLLTPTGQKLATWPHLAVREPGK